MILKGLYNTKIDRMTIAKYESYMFRVFGVIISEDLSSYKSKGFIMKDIWYRLYIPYIEDNTEQELDLEFNETTCRLVTGKRQKAGDLI